MKVRQIKTKTQDDTLGMILEARDIKLTIAPLAKKLKTLTDNLKAGYFATANAFIHNNQELATCIDVNTDRFDVNAFKDAHPKLYKQFLITQTTRRLDIK